jgi:hypothetical protein
MLTPSNPALSAIVLQGNVSIFFIIFIPSSCYEFYAFTLSSAREAYIKAHPPPITIPSEIAAVVAHIAS